MTVDLALMLQPVRLFRINKATERVKRILQQFFAFELQGGLLRQPLPLSAFEDPYIFAYLMTVAMSAVDTVSAGLSVEDKSRVARGAVIALSGMGAQWYAAVNENITRRKEEFMDGMHHAKRMVAVMHGQLVAAHDPEVAEAFKAAVTMPDGAEHTASVAAALLKDAHLGERLKALREQSR
jgi:hypothetical protein